VVRPGSAACSSCGAVLRGDIAHLGDRLEAEEQFEAEAKARADENDPKPDSTATL
jgi:hypothetical protein